MPVRTAQAASGWSRPIPDLRRARPRRPLRNSPNALAAAFNWWAKYVAHAHISWNYNQLNLPSHLPAPATPITVTTPYRIRYQGNPTWLGCTSPYWGWDRW